jgi:hypothetical protein
MSTQREGEPQAAIAATDAVVAAIIIDRLGIADKVDPQGAEQYKSALGMRIVPVRLATQAFLFVGREDDADTLSKDMVKRAGVLGGDKVLMVHTLGYSNEFIFDRHRVDNSAGLTTPSRLVASATMAIFLSIQIQIFYKKDLSDNNIEPCPVQLETWGNRPRRFSSNPVGLNNNTRPGNRYENMKYPQFL